MRPWADGGAEPDDAAAAPRRPTPLGILGTAVRGYFEGFALFAVLNVAVVLAGLAVAAAFTVLAPAIVLLPLVAIPASALTRAAVDVARAEPATWSAAARELGRRPGRKLLIAALQVLVTGVGLLNLSMAAAVGGIGGIAIAAIGAYGLIVAWAYAIALWPIVVDPRRDGRLADQLRLALLVLVTRPIGIVALLAVTAAAATACALLIVPLIVLPALVVLLCAAFVVPAADELAPAVAGSGE